jgi:hypothetical protein
MISFLVNQTADSAEKPHEMTIHLSIGLGFGVFAPMKFQTNFPVSPKVRVERLLS